MLQVGIDAPRRVLLPDVGDVHRLLDALLAGAETITRDGPANAALVALDRADLLIDAAEHRLIDPATSARHGAAAPAHHEARSTTTVGLDVAPRLLSDVRRMVTEAGLSLAATSEADVVLVVADRVLSRRRVDPWVRDAVTHLCVEARDGGWIVGPLVVPGSTACRRCVDAHHGEHDPHRALILERAAASPDPSPYDGLSAGLALSWAVRDLRVWIEGARPSTWSATVEIDTAPSDPGGADPGHLIARAWPRHPSCGCAWDAWASRAAAL